MSCSRMAEKMLEPAGQEGGHLGLEGGLLQLAEPLELAEGHQRRQVDRAGDLVDVALVQVQRRGGQELGEEPLVGALGDLQADRRPPLPLAEGLLDGREEAGLDLDLLDREVAVARDAERGPRGDLEAAEEGVQPRADDVLQQHEPPLVVAGVRQGHEPAEDRGDLEDRVELPDRPGADGLDPQDQVQALVVEVRERVRRVDRQGGQDGVDLGVEVAVEVGGLLRVEVLGLADQDAALGQRRAEFVVPDLVLVGDEFVGPPGDLDELGQRAHAVLGDVLRLQAVVELRLEAGDADLEELIEVRGRDGQEAQSVQQRDRGVAGLLQDAFVESQPAQFPVDVQARVGLWAAAGAGRLGGEDAVGGRFVHG